MRIMRAKNVDSPPLTLDRFHRWCNGTLLKPKLDADSRLKPISINTANNWLTKQLGFSYRSHTKSIYYDGHEREDVVRDRMEKMVILKVLEEVTVHFGGINCEDVHWPLLHPGEPPLVWVSQDECAYHSNDDVKSEWAEDGKGLSIKQKSRGSLLMVSMFITELHGLLECTPAQRDEYILKHPQSHMAAKFAAEPSWNGSSMLILEPGAAAGKDKYFDAEQLMEQTKLAKPLVRRPAGGCTTQLSMGHAPLPHTRWRSSPSGCLLPHARLSGSLTTALGMAHMPRRLCFRTMLIRGPIGRAASRQ
jgi:hypothetical protein